MNHHAIATYKIHGSADTGFALQTAPLGASLAKMNGGAMNIAELTEFVLAELSPDQCNQLAHALWESLDDDPPAILSADEQQVEIRRRIRAADAGEMARHSWEDVKQRLLNRGA